MKRKFDEVNNINIIENNLNNLNKKSNIDIKIEFLINEFKNKYGEENYLLYIISIYLEPVIFIKYDSNHQIIDIQPEFYLLSSSYSLPAAVLSPVYGSHTGINNQDITITQSPI